MYDYDYNDYDYDYSVNYADGYTTTEWGNSYTTIDNPALDQIYAILPVIGIISSILGLFMIISTWRIFKKAGKHGWASIVPIYNFIVLIEVAGLPLWYFILFLIPFVNIYAMFKIYIELAHKFGKGTGFGVATVFFPIICLPVLAFGKCKYEGSDNTSTTITNTDNNTGINETQLQSIAGSSEVHDNNNYQNTMSNNGFNPEPVVPSFIPTSDVSNNMQNEIGITENTNSVVNETHSKTLPENINNTLNNQNIMWEVNSPVYDNNVSVPNNQVETVNVNHMDNNFSNMNETATNNMNNNEVDNTTNNEQNNTISNTSEVVVPEISSIDIVPNVNTNSNDVAPVVNTNVNTIEGSVITDNQNNVIPSIEQLGSNPVSEKPPVNIEINNIPINSVEQNNNELPSNQVINEPVVSEINVMNNPINNEEQNVIPEIQSIPNIPVEDNSKKNITDTMSLNELLAEINIEEQK